MLIGRRPILGLVCLAHVRASIGEKVPGGAGYERSPPVEIVG